MQITVNRGMSLAASLALVFALTFSSFAVGAKRQDRDRPQRDHEAPSGSLPWSGEQTVYIRNYNLDPRWDSAIEQTVADLNHLTEYMPNAPRWVYVRVAPQTCAAMYRVEFGLNTCTTQPGDRSYRQVAPPGCPLCAATSYPVLGKRSRSQRGETRWVSHMTIDSTDYVDPQYANACGTTYDQPCSPAWQPNDQPWRIMHHEFVHGILNLGHQDHSAAPCEGCISSYPWGQADFAQAEAMFGESSVGFCELFPEADDCQ